MRMPRSIITILLVSLLALPLPEAPATATPRLTTLAKATIAAPMVDGIYIGTGKRVIYSRSARRVWLVRGDDRLSGTWSVTGHPTIPVSGDYRVYSRSLRTKTFDGAYTFGLMVRFAHSPSGSTVGFHDLPYLTGTSIPIMPLAEIGKPGFQSGGCVRQRPADAARMWAWAKIGIPVLVID